MEKNHPRIKSRIHELMASYSFIREKFVDGLPPIGDLRQAQVNVLPVPMLFAGAGVAVRGRGGVATPIPSFPQIGEGELRVWMKTSITSTFAVRWKESLPPWGEVGGGSLLPSRKGMISVLDRTLSGKL
jgi:hypothetical protein